MYLFVYFLNLKYIFCMVDSLKCMCMSKCVCFMHMCIFVVVCIVIDKKK